MTAKYAVHPGFIESKKDGEVHWIEARQLMQLYGVNPSECIVIDDEYIRYGGDPDDEKFIHLYPRRDADDYKVKL